MRGLLRRLALVLAGLVAAAALLELALRATGRSTRAQAAIFTVDASGALGPAPCAHDRVRRPDGVVTDLATDTLGLRSASACEAPGSSPVLVLGDSQAFGLGVAHADTFATRIGAHNGGVPDFAVGDALARGTALLARPELTAVRRIFVVVNQSNDFDDGERSIAERNVVRGGYLLRRDRLAAKGAFLWSTPLVHSALFYTLWARLVPAPADAPGAWLTDPPAVVPLAGALGRAVRAFADQHPAQKVELVWLPADLATSAANASGSVLFRGGDPAGLALWDRTELRDALAAGWGAPLVDLGPALTGAGSFLAHDFHLSERGHEAVSALLLSRSDER